MIFLLLLFGATFILHFLAYAYRELWSAGKNDISNEIS